MCQSVLKGVWLCLVCAACGRGDNSDDVDEKLLIDAVAQTSCLSLGAQPERGGGAGAKGFPEFAARIG